MGGLAAGGLAVLLLIRPCSPGAKHPSNMEAPCGPRYPSDSSIGGPGAVAPWVERTPPHDRPHRPLHSNRAAPPAATHRARQRSCVSSAAPRTSRSSDSYGTDDQRGVRPADAVHSVQSVTIKTASMPRALLVKIIHTHRQSGILVGVPPVRCSGAPANACRVTSRSGRRPSPGSRTAAGTCWSGRRSVRC